MPQQPHAPVGLGEATVSREKVLPSSEERTMKTARPAASEPPPYRPAPCFSSSRSALIAHVSFTIINSALHRFTPLPPETSQKVKLPGRPLPLGLVDRGLPPGDERFLSVARREERESPCGALTDEQQRQAQKIHRRTANFEPDGPYIIEATISLSVGTAALAALSAKWSALMAMRDF